MTIAFFCILAAIFIPLVLVGYAKFTTKGFDNRSPRESLAHAQGKSKRAYFAQLNSYEVFPPFAAGVLVAHLAGAAQKHIDALAVLFVISRIVYAVCYINDWAAMRSIVWLIGFICIVGLFLIGI